MKFDKEEKEILDAYKSGSLKISTPSKKEIESIKQRQKILLKKISVLLYVFMTMIIKEYKKKQWKWAYLIKRLSPALSTDTSKVN
jgi:hypothetical protein